MADQTSASIDIAAKRDEVMAVSADFEHYPDWVDSMKSAEVLTWLAGKAKTQLRLGVRVEAASRQLEAH